MQQEVDLIILAIRQVVSMGRPFYRQERINKSRWTTSKAYERSIRQTKVLLLSFAFTLSCLLLTSLECATSSIARNLLSYC